MTIEEIIIYICNRHEGIRKEQILEKLEEKRRRTNGLIADEVLLRMIAAELGVDLKNDKILAPKLSIGDLVPGLNNITIIGKVFAVFPSKNFAGKRKGKFASLFIADERDILRVVLWNDKATMIEAGQIKIGQTLRVAHAYTRENRDGNVELHAGEESEIEIINSKNATTDAYADIAKFATKIREIITKNKSGKVHVTGRVKEVFSVSTFKRQDSSSGKVMRAILVDETGEILLVIWNEKVDEFEDIVKQNAQLQIINATAKKTQSRKLEVHVDKGTFIGTYAQEEQFLKIADLKENQKNVNVKGEIATQPVIREVKTSKGEIVKLASFELKDETGKIWVSLWRQKAETADTLKLGYKIAIKNAYVKRGFGDQLELTTKNITKITLLD